MHSFISRPQNPIFPNIAALALLSLPSCHTNNREKYFISTISRDTSDSVVLLDGDIDTFDEQKMKALSLSYSSVASFFATKGSPRYIAERKDRNDHMIVFYYPDEKKAYACRNAIGSKSEMEFSGPFPILNEEMEQLRTLEE